MALLDTPLPDHGPAAAWIRTSRQSGALVVAIGGDWIIGQATRHDQRLRDFADQNGEPVIVDGQGIGRLDTVGAWILLRTKRLLEARGIPVTVTGFAAEWRPLVEVIDVECRAPPVQLPNRVSFKAFVERVGRATVEIGLQARAMVEFLGLIATELALTLRHPRRLRLPALVHQMEQTGLDALPILGLLSFLIGVVFAYQGADQLRRFGAELFTVNLLGISILRELGGLMTAIIVAGRSGSAFTAQIGTMTVNEEVDALTTLGMSTAEVLIMPRVIGLMITLPLLTFYANLMGMIGGAVMCYAALGITLPIFLHQLQGALVGWTLWIGLIKAPFFAFVIATVGCFEGTRVERNAASVGLLTTRSVVQSIFLVIVLDAVFSILFSVLQI